MERLYSVVEIVNSQWCYNETKLAIAKDDTWTRKKIESNAPGQIENTKHKKKRRILNNKNYNYEPEKNWTVLTYHLLSFYKMKKIIMKKRTNFASR